MPICGVPCSLSLKNHCPELFGSSRLLPQKPFVLLRACLALNSLYWLIRSVRVFGNAHWLVFLTHWTYALQTAYYFLALGSAGHLWVASKRKHERDDDRGFSKRGRRRGAGGRNRPKGKEGAAVVDAGGSGARKDGVGAGDNHAVDRVRKVQWGLLFLCADTSIIVSGVYWVFLYNGWLDQLNLQLHLFNTTFMMLNVLVAASPFYWEHIGISYIYGALYLAFDILYYVVGSLSSYDEKVIYFFLDWGNSPARAIAIVTFLFFVALPLAHGMHVLVARGRERLRRMHPQWGWQGTDEEELERVMEVSGMRDADVWAPLTGEEDADLYDSEEQEMGGSSVFNVGRNEESNRPAGRSSAGRKKGGVLRPGSRGQVGKRVSSTSGSIAGGGSLSSKV